MPRWEERPRPSNEEIDYSKFGATLQGRPTSKFGATLQGRPTYADNLLPVLEGGSAAGVPA